MVAAAEKEPTLQKTWADSAYRGTFIHKVGEDLNIEVEIVTRADANRGAWQEEGAPPPTIEKGFKVLPWRWVVERTLGWITRNRRFSKDYEGLLKTAEALLWATAMRMLATRLAFAPPLPEGDG